MNPSRRRALAALFIFSLFFRFSVADEAATSISTAPLFAATLADLDDKPVALSRYQGKPLVVNFWARWCAPCRAEIPEIIRFRKANLGKIEVLGIGIEDEAAPAKAFAQKYAMDYPVFVAKDQGFKLLSALGDRKVGLPYTLFIDRQGRVIDRKMGVLTQADFDAVQAALLKK